MAKSSAGILMYRFQGDQVEVFLAHPGGPYWAKKDKAAWTIPKGEFSAEEEPLAAAKREFEEETGTAISGPFLELGKLRQPNGKVVHLWAVEGDSDPESIVSNTFEMEWPPKSGKFQSSPEIDRACWFTAESAREKLHKGQVEFIDILLEKLGTTESHR